MKTTMLLKNDINCKRQNFKTTRNLKFVICNKIILEKAMYQDDKKLHPTTMVQENDIKLNNDKISVNDIKK